MTQLGWMILASVLVSAASAGCNAGGGGRGAEAASELPAPAAPAAPAAKADAPAATQGEGFVGLPAGWELAPRTKITGRQASGVVTVTATGDNPTGGYQNKLFQSPLRIWPPQFILARKPPEGMATQAITPYTAMASFKADRKVATVVVHDAAGRSLVNIAQAEK